MTASCVTSASRLTVVPGISLLTAWLEQRTALQLLETLWQELPWRQDSIRMFGSLRLQPRLTAWCSDPSVSYTYSGLQLEPAPWHPALRALRRLLIENFGQPLNSVLVNAYRDGSDSMGWHSDDEPELGQRPYIASVSLGATRRFRLRPKHPQSRPVESRGIDLANGDLLLMEQDSQRDWQHCVTRTRGPTGLRINLTFRNVLN